MNRPRHAITVTVLICCWTFVQLGCAKTYRLESARYEVGGPPVGERVVRSGVYQLKWGSGKSLHALPQTDHYLNAGEMVGFETARDGRVIAYAGVHRHELAELPRKVQTIAWEQQHRRQRSSLDQALSNTLPEIVNAAADVAASELEDANCESGGAGNGGAICARNPNFKSKLPKKYGCCD
jgi:hypothetical protein